MVQNYRLSGWACILSATLTLPSYALILLGGVFEELGDITFVSRLATLLEFITIALSIYIFLSLRGYVNEKSLTWLFNSIIGISVVFLIFSFFTFIWPSIELIAAITGIVIYVPMGILLIIFGVKLRAIDSPPGKALRAYANLSIISGIAFISIFLVILLPVFSIIMDIMLAIVFFRGNPTLIRQEDPEYLERIFGSAESEAKAAAPAADKSPQVTPVIWRVSFLTMTLLCFIACSLLLDGYQLLRFYDVFGIASSRHLAAIAAVGAFFNVAKVLAGYTLFKHYCPAKIKILAMVYIAIEILLCISGAYEYCCVSSSSLFKLANLEYLLFSSSYYLLYISLAIVYLMAGILLLGQSESLNGYKRPLSLSCLFSGGFMLLYVVDTAIYISILAVDITLLVLLLTLLFPKLKLRLPEAGILQASFLVTVLVGPLMIFAGSIFWKWGDGIRESADWLVKAGSELAEIEITNTENIENNQEHIGEYKKLESQPVIMTALMLNEHKWLGVDSGYLYESNDSGKSWSVLKSLLYKGVDLQFSKNGQQGWVGDPMVGIETTIDGGKNWSAVNAEKIYSSVSGKPYRESILGNASQIYIDPEVGSGGFTLNCRYFYTNDFAQSWKQMSIRDEDNKELCINDSPLAVNNDKTLAYIGNVLFFNLYRKNQEGERWQKVCGLGDDLPINPCVEMKTLSDTEKQFANRFKDEGYFFQGRFPSDKVMTETMEDAYYPIVSSAVQPHKVGETYWYAQDKNITYTNNNGQKWNAIQYIPQFKKLIPLTQQRAFAWTDNLQLYESNNGGRLWQRYFDPKDYSYPKQIEYTEANDTLWLFFANELLAIHLKTGEKKSIYSSRKREYSSFGLTADGKILWLYTPGQAIAQFSFDGGLHWHEMNTFKVTKAIGGQWQALTIQNVTCTQGELSCFVVRSDRSIAKVEFKAGQILFDNTQFAQLNDVADQEDFDYEYVGFIVARNNGNEFIHIEHNGRYAYMSTDKGKSWRKQSLKTNELWQELVVGISGSLILLGEDESVITHDFGKTWNTINPSDWDDEMKLCWDGHSSTMLLYGQGNMIQTIDGGRTWQRYPDDYDIDPVCGIAHSFLWLMHGGIAIYELGGSL